MKKKRMALIAGLFLCTLAAQAKDIQVTADSAGTAKKSGGGAGGIVYIGLPGAEGNYRSGMVVFELPRIPGGGTITSANFFASLERVSNTQVGDISLYAVRLSDEPNILGSDYYAGPCVDGDHGTAIMDKFIKAEAHGSGNGLDADLNTDEIADAKLTAWLQAQYKDGRPAATYAIFRLSIATEPEASWTFAVIDGASDARAPVLTLTTE